MQRCKFYKYQNSGNDFILINENLSLDQETIQKLCERRFGIGADGLLLLYPSKKADYTMRIFNNDGSEASMCGNGLACAFLHVEKPSSIETTAGISYSRIQNETFAISFPQARILNTSTNGTLVDTGTEHLVIFTTNLYDPTLTEKSKKYRTEKNVNVTLVKVHKEDLLEIRTFEKGVTEETLACGTGGAAAALLCKKSPTTILYPSKTTSLFSVDCKENIWMEIQPSLIFTGEIALTKNSLAVI